MLRRTVLLLGTLLACLACCVTTVVQADEDETALVVTATRHDASGAIVPVPSTVDVNGSPQPGLALPGEYILVSGADLPPGAAVQAFLVTPAQTFTLAYQDLATAGTATSPALMTDRYGTFANAAFLLPPPEAIHTRHAQVIVLVPDDDGDLVPAVTSIIFDLPNATG
jgi:hypothetical protein